MKKVAGILTAFAVVAMVGSAVMAQDSVIWCDIRSGNAADDPIGISYSNDISAPTLPWTVGALNGGGAGDGQTIYLEAPHSDSWHNTYAASGYDFFPNLDGDDDTSTVNMHVHMTVNDDPSGTGDVISSLGYDINISDAGAGGANRIASISYTWDPQVGDDANEGTAAGASDAGDPPSWLGAKAVKVPVVAGPTYDATGGLVPSATPYHIGKLAITGGTRTCGAPNQHAADSIFNVFLSVNNLLITRVFQTAGDADEQVAFGYSGGVPDAAVSGSGVGNVSANPDAVIKVWIKADFNGDGAANFGDNGLFGAAALSGPDDQDTAFRGDLAAGDGVVNFGDNGAFGDTVLLHNTCP